jgi:hypothetical protein
MFELIYLQSTHLTAFEFAVRLRRRRAAATDTGEQGDIGQ